MTDFPLNSAKLLQSSLILISESLVAIVTVELTPQSVDQI